MNDSLLIYDLEIVRAIRSNDQEPFKIGIEYCGGWDNKANMGISCLCVYDYAEDRYRVFFEDNMGAFYELADKRTLVGFNSISFDDEVVKAYAQLRGLKAAVKTKYDLLVETWIAAGLPGVFQSNATHGNFGLGKMAQANLGIGKSGSGALAPVDWQQGRRGTVVDYCLHDVWMTKRLIDLVRVNRGALRDPRNPSRVLTLKMPP